ncbi:hypothetical protein ES703_93062 [subsurface metagenome]
MVGKDNTIPMIGAPEMILLSSQPKVATIGFSAIRTGYFMSKSNSGTPPARAAVTYILFNSSRRVARMVRSWKAVAAIPRTTTGTQRWLSISANLAQLQATSSNSAEKSPPTLIPNHFWPRYIKISANRNPGVARPMYPNMVAMLSPIEYCRTAECQCSEGKDECQR